jgi:hypothetical protein
MREMWSLRGQQEPSELETTLTRRWNDWKGK